MPENSRARKTVPAGALTGPVLASGRHRGLPRTTGAGEMTRTGSPKQRFVDGETPLSSVGCVVETQRAPRFDSWGSLQSSVGTAPRQTARPLTYTLNARRGLRSSGHIISHVTPA